MYDGNLTLLNPQVCNHPDLFEERGVVSPLALPPLQYDTPALVLDALRSDHDLRRSTSKFRYPSIVIVYIQYTIFKIDLTLHKTGVETKLTMVHSDRTCGFEFLNGY